MFGYLNVTSMAYFGLLIILAFSNITVYFRAHHFYHLHPAICNSVRDYIKITTSRRIYAGVAGKTQVCYYLSRKGGIGLPIQTEIVINKEAMDSLIREWKTQRFQWAVYDTPMSQADNFQESIRYLFLGSLLHWGLDGITENGEYLCYNNLGTEGSIAFWQTFRLHWEILWNHKLSIKEFSVIFDGLYALPEHYQQWLAVTGVLRQKYGGEIVPFLESCQWNVPTIFERVNEEFPSFKVPNGQSFRLHLFTYLAQGKFFSANLFNGIEQIYPYLDSVLLAGLIQTGVIELPSGVRSITLAMLPEVQRAAERALSELAVKWHTATGQKIFPADLNTPLRNYGIVSTWRHRFPINL